MGAEPADEVVDLQGQAAAPLADEVVDLQGQAAARLADDAIVLQGDGDAGPAGDAAARQDEADDDRHDRVAATVALLGDLDHDVARAVAHAVADKIALLVSPALLPLVADELVHALDQRSLGATRAEASLIECTDPGDTGATAEPSPHGPHT